jgi:hypothetical protein
MTQVPKRSGSELFVVDNADDQWKVHRYLHDWCEIARAFDIATGYFEIGSLLSLDGQWQKLEHIRILMGDEVSRRTRNALPRSHAPAWEWLPGRSASSRPTCTSKDAGRPQEHSDGDRRNEKKSSLFDSETRLARLMRRKCFTMFK